MYGNASWVVACDKFKESACMKLTEFINSIFYNINIFWGFRGFSKRQTIENLDPQTVYAFRLKFQEEDEESAWSPITKVTTLSNTINHITMINQNINSLGTA